MALPEPENLEELNDEKLLHLVEMFAEISIDELINLYTQNPSLPLELLIEKCLVLNEENENDEVEQEKSEFVSQISVTPANYTPASNSAADAMQIDLEEESEPEPQKIIKVPELMSEMSESSENRVLVVPEKPSALENALQEQLKYMKTQQTIKTCGGCVDFLKKCLENILRSDEDKYRMIKMTHPKVQKKISAPGCLQLFTLVGWNQTEGLLMFANNDAVEIHNIVQVLIRISSNLKEDAEIEKQRLLDQRNVAQRPENIYNSLSRNRKRPATGSPRKSKKLTPEELRQRRLQNFGDGTSSPQRIFTGRGPKRGREFNPKKKNVSQQLKALRGEKQRKWKTNRKVRKRVFTMADIENMVKEDHDVKSRGIGEQTDMDRIGKEALRLTNIFRAKHGLPPCEWSQPIANVGKVHSRDMGTNRVPFGHQGFKERVRQFPHPSTSAAENVAMSEGLPNPAKVAVDGWIDSPGHRKNLLSNHRWCGIGFYRDSRGGYWSTQLFANF